MIQYRLRIQAADGPVTLTLYTDASPSAPASGDFILPLNDNVLFEVTARIWEMDEPRMLVVMVETPWEERRPRRVPRGPDPVPGDYIEKLVAAGWELVAGVE